MASSLASQLPQGTCVEHKFDIQHKSCGSWLASDEALKVTHYFFEQK
jgi:hypothetical protein